MTLAEHRRPPFGPRLLPRVALAWAAIALLLLLTNLTGIAERRFPDPDDTLRLVQVRDLIAGQGWFDLHQHRIDAPHGGIPMHWSRLVDLPLALMILLAKPIFGQSTAEMIALVVVPLLTLGCALLLIGRIAWRMFDEEIAGLACLAMALSVPVISQLRPLRIDHHGWQIVFALAAVNGLMARSPRTGGWIAGLAMAAWLTISIEGLPLAAVIAAICALRWLRGESQRAWLVSLMQGLATGSIALFLVTRGLGDLAPHCDAISPVHLAMFGWGALIVTLVQPLRPLAWSLGGFALAAGGALAMLASAAPQCTGGAFVELDPVVRRFWYDGVAEGLPVWRQPLAEALQIVVPPIFAILASAKLAATSRDWLRTWWTDYTLLLCASLVIAVLVSRAGAMTGALSAVPLGWQISRWLRSARTEHRTGHKAAAFAGVALALLPAFPLTLYGLVAPASAGAAPGGTVDRVSDCRLDRAAEALAEFPKGEVLVPLDIGPAILVDTPHRVVATGHHRAGKAMREVIDAFTGPLDEAHRIVSRRGIAYVALCPDLNEPATYYRAAPGGLAAKLRDGNTPDWLMPVPMPAGVAFKVWRVIS
ncbi:MAG: hypothetical protein ACTHLU_09860 [Novosphingobium sp.]